jgi:hypothetical protein
MMRAGRALAWTALVLAPLALGGCEGGLAGGLRSAGVARTPDEFMVLPTRPLEMPENFAALPPPAPGTVNRVDVRPHAEAVVGLTGRSGPVGSGGTALAAAAGPRDPAVRTQLAEEDVVWRQTHRGRLLERWFSTDREALIYRPMVLDAPDAFEYQRAQGRRVPAAPPAALEQ